MRTIMIKLVILLLLGCMLSILVAIGFFLFTKGDTTYGQPLQHENWILDHGWALPDDEDEASLFEEYTPALAVDWRLYGSDGTGFAEYVQAGWPFRCLEGGWWFNEKEGIREYGGAIDFDLSEYSWVTNYATFFPIGVKWLGLSINTLFYAALLGTLFFGPVFIRRIVRRLKGRCLQCGYDLRGSSNSVCPECGKATMLQS